MANTDNLDKAIKKAGASDAELKEMQKQSADKAANIMKKLLTGKTLTDNEKTIFEKYNNGIKADDFLAFNDLGAKHMKENPALGVPVEIFQKDGYPCCKWSNGECFSYDIKNNSYSNI